MARRCAYRALANFAEELFGQARTSDPGAYDRQASPATVSGQIEALKPPSEPMASLPFYRAENVRSGMAGQGHSSQRHGKECARDRFRTKKPGGPPLTAGAGGVSPCADVTKRGAFSFFCLFFFFFAKKTRGRRARKATGMSARAVRTRGRCWKRPSLRRKNPFRAALAAPRRRVRGKKTWRMHGGAPTGIRRAVWGKTGTARKHGLFHQGMRSPSGKQISVALGW